MSEQVSIPTASGDVVRPFTIRLSEDVRTQLEVLAEINDRSATEESRIALSDWVDRAKGDPELKKRAESVQKRLEATADTERKRIERQAEEKRKAIQAVLGETGEVSAKGASTNGKSSGGSTSRKSPTKASS